MSNPSDVPRFNVHTTTFEPLPEMDGITGSQAVLYQSEDGTRLAGSFKEAGVLTMEMPFDEFIFIVKGSSRITVDGADPFDMAVGDACYLKQGQQVTFEHSEDFQDVTVLMSDKPFNHVEH